MKASEFITEDGIITSQNTTADVKPGETQRQAKKLGMILDKNNRPPLLHKKAVKNSLPNTLFNIGLTEYALITSVDDYKQKMKALQDLETSKGADYTAITRRKVALKKELEKLANASR